MEMFKQKHFIPDRSSINTVGQITLCKSNAVCPTSITHSELRIPNYEFRIKKVRLRFRGVLNGKFGGCDTLKA